VAGYAIDCITIYDSIEEMECKEMNQQKQGSKFRHLLVHVMNLKMEAIFSFET
jgi:hypothetical protein